MTVEVTQAAREAAASWAKSNSRNQQAANMRRGSCDTSPLVQAFAKAIAAETERCARIAEEAPNPKKATTTCELFSAAAQRTIIATAIRNPIPKGQTNEG